MASIDPAPIRKAFKKCTSATKSRAPRPKASQTMITSRISFLALPREIRQQILLDTLPTFHSPRQANQLIDRLKSSFRNVAEPGRGFVLADVYWLERRWADASYEYLYGARPNSTEERRLKVWRRWVKRYKEKQRRKADVDSLRV